MAQTVWTVTYRPGTYGTGSVQTQSKVAGVNLTLKGKIYTRDGYVQDAWSTYADGRNWAYNLNGTYSADAAITLFPHWKAMVSTVSASNGTLGTALTISINRNDSSFTHTLTYTYGAASGTIATNVATSYSWTPPTSLASNFPNATSGACTITCQTYNGSTLVGQSNVSITLSIPSSIKATLGTITTTEAVAGLASKFGGFVQGKSKVTFAIATSTSSAGGATVSTVSTTVNSQTKSGTSFTTDFLKSTSNAYTTTLTDSRSRTDTKTGTITAYAYAAPSCSISSLARGSGDATKVVVYYAWNISSVNSRNDKSVTIQYKASSASTWTTATTITPSAYSGNASYTITGLSGATAYNVRVTVSDYFGTASYEKTIPSSGNRFFDCAPNDKTIAIHGDNPDNGDGFDKWFEKPVMFYKPTFVAPRRCSASLSSAGWYRVVTINYGNQNTVKFASAARIELFIGSEYNNANNMLHNISLYGLWNKAYFSDETSYSNTTTPLIDKIRYTYDGTAGYGYIDIHYTGTNANRLRVDFNVHWYDSVQKYISSTDFNAVADAPSGETVMTTYDFDANCQGNIVYVDAYSVTTSAGGYVNIESVYPRSKYAIMGITTGYTDGFVRVTGASTQWIRILKSDGTAVASTSTTVKMTLFKHN